MKTFVGILLGLILLTACSTGPQNITASNFEREYRATFEETWRAVQQSIIAYPLKVNNMDVGQIQTTAVRGSTQFKPPSLIKTNVGGQRYTLTINVLKEGPKLTKVTIIKDMVLHRDFISSPESQDSDGLEESVILYRIGREIDVEKIILRASKTKKK
jgi:hypothetical protein